MSLRKVLADDLKRRAVGRMEAGQSQVEVAKWLNVNKSVVSKIWKQFIETGTIKRKEGSGRKRKTATSEDRYLVVTAKPHREMTAIQLSNKLSSATGTRISRQTVYRRLHEGALYARRPMVCIPLTSAHRRARLNWCLEHHAWTHDQWANVLFSDESRFSLNTDSRRVSIWREPGTRYPPSNIRGIDSFRGGSLLVWAGISSSRRTPLHIFSGGTLTAQRYRDEILEPYLRPYRDQIGHNLIFMDDNARQHRARLVNEYLQSENIRRMDWPARSPDLNPIGHVWDALGRHIGALHPSPRTLVELRTALLEEWGLLLLDLLQSLMSVVEVVVVEVEDGGSWVALSTKLGATVMSSSRSDVVVASVVVELGRRGGMMGNLDLRLLNSSLRQGLGHLNLVRGAWSKPQIKLWPENILGGEMVAILNLYNGIERVEFRIYGNNFKKQETSPKEKNKENRNLIRRTLSEVNGQTLKNHDRQITIGLSSATGTMILRQTSLHKTQRERDVCKVAEETGTPSHPANIEEKDSYGGQDVMVWGGIMLDARTPLHVFGGGTLTSQRYRYEILEPYVRFFRGGVGPSFIFMDDNALPHRALMINDYLEKHVWEALERLIESRSSSPRSTQELKTALVEEWDLLPQELFYCLINGMKCRCDSCLAVRDDNKPY
ncbi:hypothetical protein LAZ67_19001989 [Cordylochernes scorpioides]|uniref:Transposase n=1 Tax=Cordylochernes scorpioides TaxID=51811 RepID=A0ABY6LI68_9ARAC|nr:hypothetical protein LAZ67_19001989 [Cordylochernes scorpioides]